MKMVIVTASNEPHWKNNPGHLIEKTTKIKDNTKETVDWHTLFSLTGCWGLLRGPVGSDGLAADPLAIHRDDRVLCILQGQNNV